MEDHEIERIENQIYKIFDSLGSWAKVSFIISQINLSSISNNLLSQYKDQYRFDFEFEPMFKLSMLMELLGIKKHTIAWRYLKENKDEMKRLGFKKLPSRRTINDYISKRIDENTKKLLDNLCQKIRELAIKKELILDIHVKQEKRTKNKNRDRQDKIKEVIRMVKKLVYPFLTVKMRHNSLCSMEDVLNLLSFVSYENSFVNGATETVEENKISRRQFFYHMHKFDNMPEIEEKFEQIMDYTFDYARKHYKFLKKRYVDLAIDRHLIRCWSDPNDFGVVKREPAPGTIYFYEFIVCSMIADGEKFILGVLPIRSELENDNARLINKLITKAKKKLRKIRFVYLDRYFDNIKEIRMLYLHKMKFIMPMSRDTRVKSYFDKAEGIPAQVFKDYRIGTKKNHVKVNLILVDDREGDKKAFISNKYIPPQIAHYVFKFYRKRWNIETMFRVLVHDFCPKTTSKEYNIRLFYFLFSCALQNIWTLINLIASLELYQKIPVKTLVRAKTFIKLFSELSIDPGGG